MNILESLWYGNICPHENKLVKTEEEKELQWLISLNEKQLVESLTAEQKVLFEKY